jgi:hypothetical protein
MLIHQRDLTWSKSEKAIARKAFDAALKQELHEVIQKAKQMASQIQQASDPKTASCFNGTGLTDAASESSDDDHKIALALNTAGLFPVLEKVFGFLAFSWAGRRLAPFRGLFQPLWSAEIASASN